MATKTTTSRTRKVEPANGHANGNGDSVNEDVATTVVVSAKPAPAPAAPRSPAEPGESLYDDAVKEIVALAENDSYARRIDNGPLSEARGKDTWSLHSQLRALDQLNANIVNNVGKLEESVGTLNGEVRGQVKGIASNLSTLTGSVEALLQKLDQETEKRIEEFRDETLRLIDKRFNQADVAFATVRAEIEIVKALVTDIIKDRIGRADSKSHR